MADIWVNVDVACASIPVNILALISDSDFKTRQTSVVYNAAGMDLVWNFTTTGGTTTQTAVTPTTSGTYDWTNLGDGMYALEIPASGGASINNDTEGCGWFTGIATGILPWRGPVIGFRSVALNDALVDGSALLDVNTAQISTDSAAADALETMLDGTGGNVLSLKQLNCVNSAGSAIVASSTGSNGHGLVATGNGSGEGISATGGATGNGIEAIGGSSSGAGVRGVSQGASSGISGESSSGPGLYGFSSTGEGMAVQAGGNNKPGFVAYGDGTSPGIRGVGGATGPGIKGEGGSSSGNGMLLTATSGSGFKSDGGAAGHGAEFTGGATNGKGMRLLAGGTTGIGMSLEGVGSGVGLSVAGGDTAAGANISSGGSGNGAGMRVVGHGSGAGLTALSGSTGNGIEAIGGGTSGDGINVSAAGSGLDINAPNSDIGIAVIADGVWDEQLSGHTTAGSAGKALSDAGSSGDPWGTALPGAYASGTAGHIVGTALPDIAPGSANGLLRGGTNAATSITTALTANLIGNITGNLSGSVGSVTGAVNSVTTGVTVTTNNDKTGYALSSGGVDSIWDDPVEGTVTARQSLRLANSANGAIVAGAATTTVTIRDLADTKDRVTATVDASGNRSVVTRDLT